VVVRLVAIYLLAGALLPGQVPSAAGSSIEKEAALGRQLAAEFRRRATPLDSPTVQDYVDRLGRRIAPHITDAEFPFTFLVTTGDPCGPIHEPAALPGGYIFVPAALFLAAQDEQEFAGMLAQAMERVARHHARTGAAVIFAGGNCSDANLVPAAFLDSLRSAESEADARAVETLVRAGFDPNALVRYIERVQARSGGAQKASRIPDRDQRVASLLAAIRRLPGIDFTHAPSNEFAAAGNEVRRLVDQTAHSPTPPSLLRQKHE
jgi:predicted Zn-dependent protease